MSKFKKFKNNLTKLFIFLCVIAQCSNSRGMKKLLCKAAYITKSPNNSLYSACKENCYNIAEKALRKGADVHYTHKSDKTLLHIACEHNNTKLVKLLINNGADVNNRPNSIYSYFKYNKSPLEVACRKNHTEVALSLLAFGASASPYALVQAIWHDNVKLVRQLAQKMNPRKSINYSCKVYQNWTNHEFYPLEEACKKNSLPMIQVIVENGGDPNTFPLHTAIKNNNFDLIELLVNNGSLVNESHIQETSNPRIKSYLKKALHSKNCKNALKFLIAGNLSKIKTMIQKNKISINEKINGKTLLDIAAKNDHLDIVEYLFNKGAKIQKKNSKNLHILHKLLISACKNGNLRLVKKLVKEKIPLTKKNSYGNTPLDYACENNHAKVVKYIYKKLDKEWAVLHIACKREKLETVKYLVEKLNCDLEEESLDDNTPIDYACKYNHLKIAKYIYKKQESRNKYPLHDACFRGKLTTVKYLIEQKIAKSFTKEDVHGNTPLDYAAKNGHHHTAKYLSTLASLYNDLASACENGDLELVKELAIKVKLNLDYKKFEDKTLLHLAAENGHVRVYKYLFRHLADPSIRDANGFTALESAQEELECPACFDDKLKKDFMRLACGHIFCKECLGEILDLALKEKNSSHLKCHDSECESTIDYQDLIKISENNRSKLNSLGNITTQEWLKKQANEKTEIKHCPIPDCKFSFINYRNSREKIRCPHCKKEYCANCLSTPHKRSISCKRAKEQKEEDKQSEEWKKQHTKPCPRCNAPVYRDGGCRHMTCKNCKLQFCWVCLKMFRYLKSGEIPRGTPGYCDGGMTGCPDAN